MSTEPKMSFEQGSQVWVWDSMWLPAVVVLRAPMGRVLVRAEHGLTFTATMANLLPRDPACQPARPPFLRQAAYPNGAALAFLPTGGTGVEALSHLDMAGHPDLRVGLQRFTK
jgi:hypothetical protein